MINFKSILSTRDPLRPEEFQAQQDRRPHFFKRIAAWTVLLLLLKQFCISPLDKGQSFTHVTFRKPILPIRTVTADLFKDALEAGSAHLFPSVPTAWLKKTERIFHPIIVQVANEHEIDPALIKAIIMAESGYDPKAISKRGAAGLMQLMPATAEALGVEDIFDPEHNIKGGVMYFKRLINHFQGDIKLALAAYNAGITKVKQYQGIPPFKATRYYIEKVFKYYEHYSGQMHPYIKET